MPSNGSQHIVQKLWNYCHTLRDDGLSYGDYVKQLTYLLEEFGKEPGMRGVIFRKVQNTIQDPVNPRRLVAGLVRPAVAT